MWGSLAVAKGQLLPWSHGLPSGAAAPWDSCRCSILTCCNGEGQFSLPARIWRSSRCCCKLGWLHFCAGSVFDCIFSNYTTFPYVSKEFWSWLKRVAVEKHKNESWEPSLRCEIQDSGFEREKGSLQSKGLSQAQGEQEQKGLEPKAKGSNSSKSGGALWSPHRQSDTGPVLEQAGRMAEPLREELSFKIFIQVHCALFSCSYGPH